MTTTDKNQLAHDLQAAKQNFNSKLYKLEGERNKLIDDFRNVVEKTETQKLSKQIKQDN